MFNDLAFFASLSVCVFLSSIRDPIVQHKFFLKLVRAECNFLFEIKYSKCHLIGEHLYCTYVDVSSRLTLKIELSMNILCMSADKTMFANYRRSLTPIFTFFYNPTQMDTHNFNMIFLIKKTSSHLIIVETQDIIRILHQTSWLVTMTKIW